MAKVIFDMDELQEKCSYWKKQLGLSHWDIALRIARARDMPEEECVGCNEFNIACEQANISIIDPIDYPETPFEQDMEKTLVHELLHIPMRYISNPEGNSLEFVHFEATIDRLARVFVDLKRKEATADQ